MESLPHAFGTDKGRIRAALAESYVMQGALETAQSQYRDLVERYRGQDLERKARLALARIYLKQEKVSQAQIQLRDLLIASPRSPEGTLGRRMLDKTLDEQPAIQLEPRE